MPENAELRSMIHVERKVCTATHTRSQACLHIGNTDSAGVESNRGRRVNRSSARVVIVAEDAVASLQLGLFIHKQLVACRMWNPHMTFSCSYLKRVR